MANKKIRSNRKTSRALPGPARMKPATIAAMVFLVVAIVVIVFVFYPESTSKNPEREYERDIAQSLGLEFKDQGSLSFLTDSGDTIVTLAVEIADTDVKRRIGLMFREKMKEKQGMLFIFPFEDIRSFWMRNTVLPLDMIFIDTRNKIVSIAKNTEPYAERSYYSTGPAKFVLEVNAGFADKYNLAAGQTMTWSLKKQ
ncbi:MAG: DUF192 domain-containing protein [Candidatus Zixiibacteriota bacterium]